tara:strand:- start:140 stop:412 length:273 start_codon:yes stop_codon:yes gene_type:complete
MQSENYFEECEECDTNEGKINWLARIVSRLSRPKMLNHKQASEYLSVSTKTLHDYCWKGEIAYHKSSKLKYYKLSDLHEFMSRNRVNLRD